MCTKPKVLLVEDDRPLRFVQGELLQAYGFEVVQAGDLDQALVLYREHRNSLSLVISDLCLPGRKTSEPLLDLIASTDESLPVVGMTSRHELQTLLDVHPACTVVLREKHDLGDFLDKNKEVLFPFFAIAA